MLKGSDFKVEVAGRLATAFELRGVHYVAVSARSHAREDREGAELSWQHSKLLLSWVRENGTLHAVVPLRITIRGDADGGPRALADLEVTLTLDYAPRDPARSIADDDIDHFVGLSSLLHAWPYLRAEVQALTAKLEIAPLVLPTLVSGNASELVNCVMRASEVQSVVTEVEKGKRGGKAKGGTKRRGAGTKK